ncbi:MAG: site-2 protease family protein [Bacteroidetes bacterium]|nr:site-2 protease family protein [Bacteroidota bacterium]
MPDIQINPKLISFLTFIPMFIISITIHEFAHAFIAQKFGDDTAKNEGRYSLNPLKHIDLVGTIILPIASFVSGFALIGWAKPVPINSSNFKNRLRDDAIVSFAGPFSNFMLAILFFIFFVFTNNLSNGQSETLLSLLWYGVFFNVFLCLFNLIPIPPLDGAHILFDLFPNKYTASLFKFGLYGSFILLLFIYSPLWNYFMKLVQWVLHIFLVVGNMA